MATTIFIPPAFRANPDQPSEFSNDILGDLVRMSATKAQKASAAVAGRKREMEEQGMIPYVPSQPKIVDDIARSTASRAGLPLPASGGVQTVQQRPTGGKIVNYPSGEKIVMSRFGTGSATKEKKGPTTFDGKPAAKYFAETAARQGQNNKFAAALPGGKGIAFEETDRMSPEKQKALIFEAMNRKKA